MEHQDIVGTTTLVRRLIDRLVRRDCLDITSSIDLHNCGGFPISGGGFSDVYRGTLYDGTSVAIKSQRAYARTGEENDSKRGKALRRTAREIHRWSGLRHPHVLDLMGVAIFQGHLSTVSRWMDNGDLRSFLRGHPDVDRIKLCIEVSAGLCYIHTRRMVHGDLKASNILISASGNALISGFGNSGQKDLTLTFTPGTVSGFGISIRWAAPELLIDVKGASQEADVYAYGMTALEILTGEVPFPGMSEIVVLVRVVQQAEIPPRPNIDMHDDLWGALVQCWAQQPGERPKIGVIMDNLMSLSETRYYPPPVGDTTPPYLLAGGIFERNRRSQSEPQGIHDALMTAQIDDSTAPESRTRVIISRTMSLKEVISRLCSVRCRDLTLELDNPSRQQVTALGGGYGDVFIGRLKNGQKVALKCLRELANRAETVHQHAARELQVWSKLKHVNVLELLGLALFNDRLAMVSPWMEYDLHTYLRSRPTADRCKLSTQIAAGLSYMHDENIVHGDVKPSNVLVSADGIAKLADFGSAAVAYDPAIQVTVTLTQGNTPRYAAPELLSYQKTKTRESDVYALGMTILVVISGTRPFPTHSDLMVLLSVAKGEKPERPESIPKESDSGDLLWKLLLETWDFEPKKRPQVREVLNKIRAITPESLKPQTL